MDKVTLLPCPFCGAAGMMIDEDRTTKVQIMCGADCELLPVTDWHERDQAIAAWNTRATPAPDSEKLREALRHCEQYFACLSGMTTDDAQDAMNTVRAALGAAPASDSENLRGALGWYAEQVANCRKIGAIGDPARHALDADGGNRARTALGASA